MITKEMLKNYASKLMFDMKEEEYETLEKEFELILKQMELINQIEGIDKVEPMTFPFESEQMNLRDDQKSRSITIEELLKNAATFKGREIKVPKVVE